MSDQIIYLVERLSWRVGDSGYEEVDRHDPRPDVRECPDSPGQYEIVVYHRCQDEAGVPVQAFRDYHKAQSFLRAEEQARRARTNPFRYGNLVEHWTSLDEGRLRDWLLDAGLDPPGNAGEEKPHVVAKMWHRWWLKHRDKLTEENRLGLACALNDGLAGLQYGQRSVAGRTDLPWLDEHFNSMDRLTADQRTCVRGGLFGSGIWDFPSMSGERDYERVARKWRDWWDEQLSRMTSLQNSLVWEALDRVRFFALTELVE